MNFGEDVISSKWKLWKTVTLGDPKLKPYNSVILTKELNINHVDLEAESKCEFGPVEGEMHYKVGFKNLLIMKVMTI